MHATAAHAADLGPLGQGMLAFIQMHLAWVEGQGRWAMDKGGQAIEAFRHAGFDRGVISVLREHAVISARHGYPDDALALLREIVDDVQPNNSFTIRESISALLAASSLCYWTDDLEGAQRAQRSARKIY